MNDDWVGGTARLIWVFFENTKIWNTEQVVSFHRPHQIHYNQCRKSNVNMNEMNESLDEIAFCLSPSWVVAEWRTLCHLAMVRCRSCLVRRRHRKSFLVTFLLRRICVSAKCTMHMLRRLCLSFVFMVLHIWVEIKKHSPRRFCNF